MGAFASTFTGFLRLPAMDLWVRGGKWGYESENGQLDSTSDGSRKTWRGGPTRGSPRHCDPSYAGLESLEAPSGNRQARYFGGTAGVHRDHSP